MNRLGMDNEWINRRTGGQTDGRTDILIANAAPHSKLRGKISHSRRLMREPLSVGLILLTATAKSDYARKANEICLRTRKRF